MRALLLAPVVVLAACAHAASASAPSVTATEFVRSLAAESGAGNGAFVEASIDRAFAAEVPSSVALASLFEAPTGCTVVQAEGPAHSARFVSEPTYGGDATEVPRFEAIVEELQASTEVTATCASGAGEPSAVLYVVVVRRGDDGAFRVLAWRDLRERGEETARMREDR